MVSKRTITLTIVNESISDFSGFSGKELKEKIENSGEPLKFTCILSFLSLGKEGNESYLPPFLPALRFKASAHQYARLYEQTLKLGDLIKEGYQKNKNEIYNKICGIGSSIFDFNEMTNAWKKIFNEDTCDTVVIFTNDAFIPWQWVCDLNNRFLIDKVACGTIFANEKTQDITMERKAKWNENVKEAFKGKKSLLIYDNYELPGPQKEIEEIEPTIKKRIKDIDHICPRDENDNKINLADKVKEETVLNDEDLELIHFSGHIVSKEGENYLIPGDPDTSEGIKGSDFQGEYSSEPLIFLNGCFSGQIFDLWDKSANIATNLLNKYASGCVVTISNIPDISSIKFSKRFYDYLLENPGDVTYGEALLKVRKDIYEEDKKDPTRFFFHFFGDPNAKIIYTKGKSEEIMDSVLTEFSKERENKEEQQKEFKFDDIKNAKAFKEAVEEEIVNNLDVEEGNVDIDKKESVRDAGVLDAVMVIANIVTTLEVSKKAWNRINQIYQEKKKSSQEEKV